MKLKVVSLSLFAALLLSLTACGGTAASQSTPAPTEAPAASQAEPAPENTAEPARQENPITEYASLEEVNAAVGCRMAKPGVMGIADETFTTIAGEPLIGQYTFSLGAARYTCRAANTYEDISGVYTATGTLGTDLCGGYGEGHLWNAPNGFARWYLDGFQYTLYAEGAEGYDEATFLACADELYQLSLSTMTADVMPLIPAHPMESGALADGIYPAAVEIIADGSPLTCTFRLYSMDCYDTVDVNTVLAPDKTLFYDRSIITVEAVERDNDLVVVNGGLEMGGCCLKPADGGIYVGFGWDDAATYTNLGCFEIPVSETAVLSDDSDLENPGKVVEPAGLADYLKENQAYLGSSSFTIRTENGIVVEMTRKFVP